jgi:hypothetical protein
MQNCVARLFRLLDRDRMARTATDFPPQIDQLTPSVTLFYCSSAACPVAKLTRVNLTNVLDEGL